MFASARSVVSPPAVSIRLTKRADVVVRELLAVDLGPSEARDEVVARALAALGDQRQEVVRELLPRPQPAFDRLLLAGQIRQEVHDRPVPALEIRVVCLRQGEHLLDHRDRELVREARHEVDLAAGLLAGGDRGRLTLQERPGELFGDPQDRGRERLEARCRAKNGLRRRR